MNTKTPGARALAGRVAVAAALAAASVGAIAGPDVSVSVGGEISPGVYGRIDIGNRPPPAVVYAQPVVIVKPARPVAVQPIYMNVPPGHAKNWGKHCHKYNACGVPVYFVKTAEYEPRGGKGEGHPGRGHGRGHGRD